MWVDRREAGNDYNSARYSHKLPAGNAPISGQEMLTAVTAAYPAFRSDNIMFVINYDAVTAVSRIATKNSGVGINDVSISMTVETSHDGVSWTDTTSQFGATALGNDPNESFVISALGVTGAINIYRVNQAGETTVHLPQAIWSPLITKGDLIGAGAGQTRGMNYIRFRYNYDLGLTAGWTFADFTGPNQGLELIVIEQ